MNINYKRMESQHVDAVVKLYIDYYNTYREAAGLMIKHIKDFISS